MNTKSVDIAIIGAGPVGLMCAYLAKLCGLTTVVVDKSNGPLEVGRADALNARTLQLLETVNLFDELYPLGKACNTSSVWANGKFLSRQSSWWDELEGCLHKHFLMIGQSFVEKLLDRKLKQMDAAVLRSITAEEIHLVDSSQIDCKLQIEDVSQVCVTKLSNGDVIHSKYVIGADGSRSFVREQFKIPFEVIRPQIVWAVIDGIIETDFQKVPEIIIFQAETSDVAWIPREGKIDRFYVRMDTKDFAIEDAIAKINNAMKPYTLRFKEVAWFSQFSVKESVAEKFQYHERVFLVGDAAHIHSVNGGQGLNTGLADAFNLIWKLNMVLKEQSVKPLGDDVSGESSDKSSEQQKATFSTKLLRSYEGERKPVALSVVEASGELVRSTKYSEQGTHAEDYVKIVQKRAGNITGMGIRYAVGDVLSAKGGEVAGNQSQSLSGSRLFDFKVSENGTRIYSLLDYTKFTLLIFSDKAIELNLPTWINLIQIPLDQCQHYANKVILVRPDSYIHSCASIESMESIKTVIADLIK